MKEKCRKCHAMNETNDMIIIKGIIAYHMGKRLATIAIDKMRDTKMRENHIEYFECDNFLDFISNKGKFYRLLLNASWIEQCFLSTKY